MSHWFRRFLGLILLVSTVGLATCQSMVKAETAFSKAAFVSFNQHSSR